MLTEGDRRNVNCEDEIGVVIPLSLGLFSHLNSALCRDWKPLDEVRLGITVCAARGSEKTARTDRARGLRRPTSG